ncbi:DUF2599 domain-containing protein [Mycobacterium shigaense]|uniref:Uncharacterized protein n=1 Tax=Mycobacterium shigaense TaxID=722731 RepID=A0A1Z4ED29_9MYCO|nr:DUF2599 domain-containing protein [Mycobacterium shigaense]MEA1122277.1 DUF2599 domain-containing protein [Mycobacterium shigaense]PRI16955.1 hypothetical protein B2J96_00305 [Mycobacterium shigaense]BAX90859.1 hypothetical protein MSG_00695 [Mycobacterium shigaense]
MKALLALSAMTTAAMAGLSPAAATASADPAYSPPFIDHTQWTQWQRLTSLRVFPTPSGRAAARQPGGDAAADEAWTEVLAKSPNADTPGMRAQFFCHWQLAELVQPGKPSWNLEPWRPVVDDAEMTATGCNPGGPEEQF